MFFPAPIHRPISFPYPSLTTHPPPLSLFVYAQEFDGFVFESSARGLNLSSADSCHRSQPRPRPHPPSQPPPQPPSQLERPPRRHFTLAFLGVHLLLVCLFVHFLPFFIFFAFLSCLSFFLVSFFAFYFVSWASAAGWGFVKTNEKTFSRRRRGR